MRIKVNLGGPRVVPNGPSVSKSYPKIGLPKVAIRGQIILQLKISRVTQKKVSRTSSNGPPRSYYGALKTNLKTCAKGTKLRVYTHPWGFHPPRMFSY